MSIQDRNLKAGTALVARYKKKDYRCEVVTGEDGKLAYRTGGKEYESPSGAGSAVMGGQACNGWRFWTVEGEQQPRTKATTTRTAAKKAAPKAKAKQEPKAKRGSKRARKVAGGANGAEPASEPKPVHCGVCDQPFPNGREASEHMRDEHGSVEAPGIGSK
jgi:hypothetical protein